MAEAPEQGFAAFSGKGQKVNILGSVGHPVTALTTQLC